MANVTEAYLRGHQIAQAELEHNDALEQNKLHAMVLRHQLSALKLEDALRTRDIALKQAELMGQIPAGQQPQEPNPSFDNRLPGTSFGGAMTAPGSVSAMTGAGQAPPQAPATVLSPQPAMPSPTQNAATSIPAVNLPDQGVSLPAMLLRRSLEDTMAQQTAAQAGQPFTLTAKPGEVSTRYVGGKPIASATGGPEKTNEWDAWMQSYPGTIGKPNWAALSPQEKGEAFKAFSNAKETQDTADTAEMRREMLRLQLGAMNGTGDQSLARAIAEYRMAPPSPRTLASPQGAALMKAVSAINPAYDATQYPTRQKMREAFTSGNQGQQVASLNTAIEHLGLLNDFAHALKNGNFTPGNALYNTISQTFGQSAVNNFNLARDIMAGELATAMKKNGATDPEIQKATNALSSSSSPDQLMGAIQKVAIPMIAGKARVLEEQFHQTMGEKDPFSVYTPGAKAVLDNVKSSAPKIGDIKTYPNGNKARWDGVGWELVH